MPNELISMGDQFKGLPMEDLIGGPLKAACDSQIKLANATADFIKSIGFIPDKDGSMGPARTAKFQYTKMIQNRDGSVTPYKAELNVPMLAIVKVPALSIKKVDITFDMEVKSSFSERNVDDKSGSLKASAKIGFGPFSANVSISGSISSHKENTRASDNSAKYHVQALAEDDGMPEGLSRVIDILQQGIEPILLTEEGKAMDGNGKPIKGTVYGALDEKGEERKGSEKGLASPLKQPEPSNP